MFRLTMAAAGLLLSFAALAQQPPPKPYSSKQIHELGGDYKALLKNFESLEKQRGALEAELREYDIRLKALSQQMAETEEKVDFASGIYSYDARFKNTTRDAEALQMAYNLKSADLLNHVSSEKFQLDRMRSQISDKYDRMKKFKSGR